MIDDWINKELLTEKEILKMRDLFSKGKPFSHMRVFSFLNEQKVRELEKALKSEKFQYKESDLFQFKQTQDFSTCKNKIIKEFYKFVSSSEFAQLISKIARIKLESGAIDLAGNLYENTDYLLCHDDQLEDRKIAYILYLGDNFSEKDGGSLVLFDSEKGRPTKVAKRNYPQYNSLILFEVSSVSFHEVEEVMNDKKRYCIGGWLH